MAEHQTVMHREVAEIPEALERLLNLSEPVIADIAGKLRRLDPRVVCTIARGSSDHAAAYLKYAIEIRARIPVASIGPSVQSIYGVTLDLDKAVCLAISQSGRSPDIVESAASAGRSGALSLALTNDTGSPLAAAVDHPIDMRAGREESIAATKTFVNSIATGLLLLAHWQEDHTLQDALQRLPDLAAKAIDLDWEALVRSLIGAQALLVLGRGPSFSIAHEVALKFKETCRIQGEAFSAAEVLHGPVSIVAPDYPVLALIARDRSESAIAKTADGLTEEGALVFATSDQARHARRLPIIATGHPLTDPLMLIVPFYVCVERLARERGLDPDRPERLRKITETR